MPMLFSIKKTFAKKKADLLSHVDKSIKMKNNGAKRNEGTFRIDKNVRLIAINHEFTMTLIAIKYLNRLPAALIKMQQKIKKSNKKCKY